MCSELDSSFLFSTATRLPIPRFSFPSFPSGSSSTEMVAPLRSGVRPSR